MKIFKISLYYHNLFFLTLNGANLYEEIQFLVFSGPWNCHFTFMQNEPAG